ncbi:MAG: hypothetical protein IKR73_08325 [Oscillospiraceae bacterium]|nr:hypothetical protein [Oscillospiraceae bacterium]
MIRRTLMMILVMAIGMMMTGCSSYKGGTVKDGVYSNGVFKVTTPEGFVCYTGDDVAKTDHYIVAYNKAQKRGADKSFKCEYAADGGTAEILVASEENVSDATLDGFADIVCTQFAGDILGYTVEKNENVTIDGVRFRELSFTLSTGGHIRYYITQSGNRFVYVYTVTLDGDFTGASDKADHCISAA